MFDFITDDTQREQAIEAHNKAVTELNDTFRVQLDEEVSGLKSKNTELLDEKRNLQNSLKKYDGFDFDGAKEAMEFLQNNKDAQMIRDGKVDELIEKKTSQLRSDHEAAMQELTSNLSAAMDHGTRYEGMYKAKVIEDALREVALAKNVRPEAISDILMRGKTIFTLADDLSLESRDTEGKLRKTTDEKVLTPSNWMEGLKETSPHYWPQSEGAGARSGGGAGDDIYAARIRAADAGDHAEYRRLDAIIKERRG